MAYTQLVAPRTNVSAGLGWCLWLVQESFGVPHLYATAADAWGATGLRHTERSMPNVCVPVWFNHWGTYNGVYKNWGHVVVWVPGRGFFSSPYNASSPNAWLGTLAEVERMYSSSYLGWTEDISGVRVVKQENGIGGSTVDTIKSMYWRLLGREADQGGIDTYVKAASARGWEFVYNDLKNSGEGQADWTRRNPERVASLEAGIQARDVRIQELQTALANEQSKPPREVIKEVEKIVEKPIEVVKEVPVYTHDQATADTVQATSKTVNSIKGMLVNFIGYVKGKLGK